MATHNTQVYDLKNFIYLTAMMKSCSTLMQLVLSAIQEPDSRAHLEKTAKVPANDFLPMSLEFLEEHFPNGGVFKNHAPIEYSNATFLKQTGCKYVALLRHPADHLAGLYCHMRGLPDRGEDPAHWPSDRSTSWFFSAGQYPRGCFRAEPDVAIDQLISCGYLFKILIWMADWIAFRHPEQSRLIRYEDILGGFDKIVTDLCWFIRGAAPDDDLMRYLRHVYQHETAEGESKSVRDNYPRGWTGHVGTWRDYFSPSNVRDYNLTVSKFVDAYPQARALLDTYPDLMISRTAEHAA
jgi:hypothetical protein